MNAYQQFLNYLKEQHPIWTNQHPESLPSENLLCLNTFFLSKEVLEDAKKFIQAIYSLRNQPEYQKMILNKEILQPHFSVLMSFDFHLTDQGLKLIEINTNASHALTTAYLLDFLEPQRNQFLNIQQNIIDSFKLEYELYFNQKPSNILIIDESPATQKAYFEFLMYRELFNKNGIPCEIADISDLKYTDQKLIWRNQPQTFIYNRSTDFYFDTSPALKEAYHKSRACITPHPEEYELLADKKRLLDFRNTEALSQLINEEKINIIQKNVPQIEILTKDNLDEIWPKRKNLFFKPSQSYGSRAAYKGESVSRSKLASALETQTYVAQEYISAPEINIQIQGVNIPCKYDLRFYVYNGTIQLAAARLYQGQTTNFQTLGLGLAPVLFK